MAVKPGVYKVYIDWGTDGTNYPYHMENLLVLSISDNTTAGQIVEDTPTSNAEAILAGSGFPGFFDTFKTGFCFTTNVSRLQQRIREMVNSLGTVNISISPPADYEDWQNMSGYVYFNLFLDSSKTRNFGSGRFRAGSASGDTDRFPRIWLASRDELRIHIPYIRVSTDGTSAYLGYLEGYSNGFNRYYLRKPTTAVPNLLSYFEGIEPWVEDTDPFVPGGESGPGGGDGTFDFTSTDIPIPGLPTIGAFDCGFTSLFRPSQSEIKALANYMWAGTFDIENLRKIVANPMDVIMGLYIVPTSAGHPSAVSSQLVVGNITTGLSMAKLTEQYYEVDCGTIQVLNKWGAYFDYFPYSKLSLYLPYIGYVPLSPDDCMGGDIHVIYHVDVMGGTCTAFVYCTSNRGTAGHTLYTFNGSCAVSCPITAGQYASIFDFISNAATAAFSMAMGKPDMLTQVQNAIRDSVTPEVSRSGDFGGSGGLMGIQYPYLILTVPNKVNPKQQSKFRGYPSFVTKTIGDVTGYNEFEVTHLNNMTCTSQEAEEIMTLLRNGVIL